jgi:hypothetical protein
MLFFFPWFDARMAAITLHGLPPYASGYYNNTAVFPSLESQTLLRKKKFLIYTLHNSNLASGFSREANTNRVSQ